MAELDSSELCSSLWQKNHNNSVWAGGSDRSSDFINAQYIIEYQDLIRKPAEMTWEAVANRFYQEISLVAL